MDTSGSPPCPLDASSLETYGKSMDGFEILLLVVVANLVVGVVCSFAAQRAWGHWLCLVAIAINVFPILLAVSWITGMATGRYGHSSLAMVLCLFIFVEAVWFLNSFRRYRRVPPPAS